MKQDPIRVLFLCTGNSARSIIAEVVLNHEDPARFRAYSAGSRPVGRVNPLALEILRQHGYETRNLRSKSWDEFSAPGASDLDLVLTVCDQAAGESCPVWPGRPATAHWGVPDPAAVTGDDAAKRRAFAHTLNALSGRIRALVALPAADFEPRILRTRLIGIGAQDDAGHAAGTGTP